MGKRIIVQARGHGSLTYRVRDQAYRYELSYPKSTGKGIVLKIVNSPGHTAPLCKIKIGKEIFFNAAVINLAEGQEIEIGENASISPGNILPLGRIPLGTDVCSIEIIPYNGPKLIRTSGASARVAKELKEGIVVSLPSGEEKVFSRNARATIGVIAGAGRTEKPIIRAGKMYKMMRARNKLWPRTSAVKMNIIDHPFGSGRGKRIKSKIAKRNAPPGAKVGTLWPKRTGRRKK